MIKHFLNKIEKDYHEVNLVVPWSLAVGITFFLVFLYFIWVIEFDIFRNPSIITDDHLRYALILIALFLAVEITRILNRFMAKHVNKGYLSRFQHLKSLNSYVESIGRSFFTEKKYDHVVLILHGFSASPQEFQFLIPYLEENKINYHVPSLDGFGLDNTALLNQTRRQDWYRSCLAIYDTLSQTADKVSVIGHSMGAILAAYIASNRPVHGLILTAPGFYPIEAHKIHKLFLMIPVISFFYTILLPYVPKAFRKERGYASDTLDPEVVPQLFHYLAVPISSVREVFLMQNEVRIGEMSFDNLAIIYGRHEQTVDVERLFTELNTYKIRYKSYCMKNSAHNVLEDFDREEVCKLIIDILNAK